MNNLDRQDKRQRRDSDGSPILKSTAESSRIIEPLDDTESNDFVMEQQYLADYRKACPPFLKSILNRLTLKYAKILSALNNNEQQEKQLQEALFANELPKFLFQQAKVIKTIEEIADKTNLTKSFINIAANRLIKKNAELQAIYAARQAELTALLEPFKELDVNFKAWTINHLFFLDISIKFEMFKFKERQLKDQAKKQAKVEKFASKKEKDAEVKVLTIKEYNLLTQRNKKPATTRSKNSKGGKQQKKLPAQPKKQAKNPKMPSKGYGKKKRTSGRTL